MASVQGKQLGEDNVHITYCCQNCSCYGGIKRIILSREGILEVKVTSEVALELKTETQIKVDFSKATINISELISRLKTLCDGFVDFQCNSLGSFI